MNFGNPMNLFSQDVPPQQKSILEQMNILLGGLGNGPAARPLSPSLGMPVKKPEPLVQKSILGGTWSG